MTTTMKMEGTTVLVVTPQKTKYPPRDLKFYKKKDEKKRRDKVIRNNRRNKMEGNNIYSEKEYGRHNGSQPFEIYDRFTVVDKDNLDVDQQFMTRKEYDYSVFAGMDEMYNYMYDDEEVVRQKRARSESSDEEIQPAKKMKGVFSQQMTEYQQAREVKLTECLDFCHSKGITLMELDTYNHSKGITRMELDTYNHSKGISIRDSVLNDYNQAMKDIATSRHNLEMAMVDYFWMPESSREYLNDPDPFDSDDEW